MIHVRQVLLSASLGIVAFSLVACGSDSDDSSTMTGGTGGTTAGTGGTSAGIGGTGGASGAGGTVEGAVEAGPADSDKATVVAYLESDAYKQAHWIAQTPAPRDKSSDVSPHGRVRIWMNDRLVDSFAAGNGEFGGTAHYTWSMVVKEFYDDADVMVGRGAMLKKAGAADNWVFYCESTDDTRCGLQDEPLPYYGDSNAGCNFCHGGMVFSRPPM